VNNKVVLVEDDNNLRKTFEELLDIIGYDVVRSFEDGGTAYVDLHKENLEVDIILTDFFMPVMNADELINSLKSIKAYKNCKYVVMTGFDIESVYSCFPKDSGIHFLNKPFSAEELVEVLEGAE
jgi:two-component system NtrC family response regulator/two-component system nitrogen regulation response regulator GlnG